MFSLDAETAERTAQHKLSSEADFPHQITQRRWNSLNGKTPKKNWFKAGEMVRCLLLFQRMQLKGTWCSLPASLGTHAHLTYTHTNTQTYKGGSVDLKWWGKTRKGLMFKQYFYCELGWITSDLCPCESCFLFSKGNGITVTQKMTLFEAV